MGIIDQLGGNSLYLDTNVFIYALEGYEEYTPVLHEIFKAIEQQNFTAFTSELTIAEVLVKPFNENNIKLVKQYLQVLRSSTNLTLIPVSQEILKKSAQVRAESNNKTKLPDAIHLSSALSNNCSAFITNDKRIKRTDLVKVVMLSDFVSAM